MLKAPKGYIVIALAFIMVGGIAAWFAMPKVKDVTTFTAKVAPAVRLLAVNGRIRPRLEVEIRPSLGGELVFLPFDVGAHVVSGQVVARLDDAPEAAAIAEAQAAVQAQMAVLAQARRDLARYEALGEFVTKRDLEQRRLAVEEGARELSRRQANVTQVSELRDRRVLHAPFSGTILERPVDPGQTVGVDSVIYRLADLSLPEVTAEVDEIYAAEIRPGMDVMIGIPGEPGQLKAKVEHIEPRINPATGARVVRIAFSDARAQAPSGLTVTVNFVIEKRQQAISIPRSVIVQSAGSSHVMVIDAEGIVRERAIRFVDWPSEQVIVTAGINAGERILSDPAAAKPGEKARATN